jgi:hypothetical protein
MVLPTHDVLSGLSNVRAYVMQVEGMKSNKEIKGGQR